MYQQIEDFMKDQSSNLLTDFRKNHGKKTLFNERLKNGKKLDKGDYICARFMICQKPLTH